MYKQSLSNVREDSKTWDFAISLVGIFTSQFALLCFTYVKMQLFT